MTSGVRFRAYPTAQQQAALRQWIGHQRFIYNAKVREQEYFSSFARKSLALTGLKPLPDQAYSQFVSTDTAFLRDVPSQILRNGAYRFAQATCRMLQGVGGAPNIRKKHGRQSALVTSELFDFTPHTNPHTGELQHKLTLGTKKHPLGALRFKAHRPYEMPKMLSISLEPDGKWYVSFSYAAPAVESLTGEEPFILRTPEELSYEFSLREDLANIAVGLDRGVAIPVACSTGQTFNVPDINLKRIAKNEVRCKRYQRRMARQELGSRSRDKTRRRIAKLKMYGSEVRKDFAHRVSHALVASDAQVFVLEDLKLKNMTAAPKPKKDARGRFAPNGAAAKAGLNKAILSSSMGLVKVFIGYKAAAANKLVLSVAPHHSSNECSACGQVDKESRQSQAVFCCTACGHRENADLNAAKVLQMRGVAKLRSGGWTTKKKKTTRVRGKEGASHKDKKVESVRLEPGSMSPKPVENVSAVRSLTAQRAVFSEAGNRTLNAYGVRVG